MFGGFRRFLKFFSFWFPWPAEFCMELDSLNKLDRASTRNNPGKFLQIWPNGFRDAVWMNCGRWTTDERRPATNPNAMHLHCIYSYTFNREEFKSCSFLSTVPLIITLNDILLTNENLIQSLMTSKVFLCVGHNVTLYI